MKKYNLLIKSHCYFPDFEDECVAKNKKEAASIFKMNNHNTLREFSEEDLLKYIDEE